MNNKNSIRSSREKTHVLMRVVSLLQRYGIFPGRFGRCLNEYSKIVETMGAPLTFSVSSNTLKRYSRVAKILNQGRYEMAVHGYNHEDHFYFSREQQREKFEKAMKIFSDKDISFSGFRCPYLRWNEETMKAIGELGFSWDSSKTVVWNVVEEEEYSLPNRQAYQKLLNLYQPKNVLQYPALPEFINGFVEIPVSIPDDEALVDRLKISDKNRIGRIWNDILEKTYERGEIFTLQLHPERIFLCDTALEYVLLKARQKHPPMWIAQLGEVAEWWREKDGFAAKVQRVAKSEYRINLSCSDRATILIKNLRFAPFATVRQIRYPTNAKNAMNPMNAKDAPAPWFGSYKVVNQKNITVKSNCRPVIGLAPDSSGELISFLKQNGYIIEVGNKKLGYGIYLEGMSEFSADQKLEIINQIENSDSPLVRFWRWPNKARSALAITGDIDAITIWDFILRFFNR